MLNFNPLVGQPIRSIQTYLRRIAYTYDEIPLVIPDGIFGEQTKAAVTAFQKKYDLPQTGEVDRVTFERIVEVYEEIIEIVGEPKDVKIYPSPQTIIKPGEQNVHLYPIQSMILLLSQEFTEIEAQNATGIHDETSVQNVKTLQKFFGLSPTGEITKKFWDKLADFYESHISRNRFKTIN